MSKKDISKVQYKTYVQATPRVKLKNVVTAATKRMTKETQEPDIKKIAIGGSRGEKAENKTAEAQNIKIGDNNIASDTSSSEDSNKVVTKDDKDKDNISNEEEEAGDRINKIKQHCRAEQNKNKTAKRPK